MIEIFNTEVFGLDRAVKSIKNSYIRDIDTLQPVTEREWEVASKLGSAEIGHGHDGFLKGILVTFDIKYPQYWTPEFQRYSHIFIQMSTSKIHNLTKNMNKDDYKSSFNKYVDDDLIERIRSYAQNYNNAEKEDKYYWFMKTLSNLPMGYELQMTVNTNYLQLKTIFEQRKNHKLKEDWGEFCKWCLNLPRFSELTGCKLES